MSPPTLFSNMWKHYSSMNPQAKKIHKLLESHGETISNDHIALRTFNLPKVNMYIIAKHFIELGYEIKAHYAFEVKKLNAIHLELDGHPRVFISELRVEAFSPRLQHIVKNLVKQIPKDLIASPQMLYCGRPWRNPISKVLYDELYNESEYCAWMCAHGYIPNHFTININKLKNFSTIVKLNDYLKQSDFILNDKGGEIKGSVTQGLQQSSTMADIIPCKLSDGVFNIPGCYYEFAQRHLVDGILFSGFIEASADKIFESTNNS